MPIPNASIYTTSTEEVPFSVTPPVGFNPTSGSVSMAFLQSAPPVQPVGTQWVTGSWQGSLTPYVALCLIGIGGAATLSAGLWYSWIRISAAPELVVKYAGVLQVS